MTTLRDLKELRWRSRGPKLPNTVLDAVTLKIRSPLPDSYRQFLSQMDGGRLANVSFRYDGQETVLEGFYPVAEATDRGAKLQKSGKLPEGVIPVAFVGDKEDAENKGPPVIFMDVQKGKIWFRTSPRARWEDGAAVFPIANNFAEFLSVLGSPGGEVKPLAGWSASSGNGAGPAKEKKAAPEKKAEAAAPAAKKAPAPAAKKAPAPAAKKAPAKQAPAAKKAPSKKAPSKKVSAKQASGKKAAAKKAPAKKTAGKKR